MKKFCTAFLVAVCLILFAEKPYVLVVSFDGFRYDYTEKTATPNFDYLKEHGTKAKSLQSIFPSKTFPNHYAIATGAYAETHGLMANHFYSSKHKDIYTIRDANKVKDPKWYRAEPIWVTAEKQNVKTAAYFWVGSETPIHGWLPSIYKKYEHNFPFEARIDSVLAWFNLPEEIRPQLIMLYFDEPDSEGHKLGPDNPKLIPMIQYLDALLGKIINGISRLEITSQLNLIVLSDHGMTEVKQGQTINLNDYLRDSESYHPYFGGPVVQLTMKETARKNKSHLLRELQKIPHIELYQPETLPERFHFKNQDCGDFILVAEEGWVLSNTDNYGSAATHGYDPQLKNMHGIFYAMGPNIKKNHQIETFENIHIYPFICELLQIKPYENPDDGPDGKPEVLKSILEK